MKGFSFQRVGFSSIKMNIQPTSDAGSSRSAILKHLKQWSISMVPFMQNGFACMTLQKNPELTVWGFLFLAQNQYIRPRNF